VIKTFRILNLQMMFIHRKEMILLVVISAKAFIFTYFIKWSTSTKMN